MHRLRFLPYYPSKQLRILEDFIHTSLLKEI